MSRHRIVRTMNYDDEYFDDEDDMYSRSVEDNYCVSPSTAAQFTWNREKNLNFAAYMGEEREVINEEDETEEDASLPRVDSSGLMERLRLSGEDQARLNSCLEEVQSILGEAVPESIMIDVIVQNKFNIETALNQLLTQQDAPKPQREPRERKNRIQASTVPSASQTVTLSSGDDLNVSSSKPPPAKTLTLPTPAPIVTPSKSAVNATVGFLKEDTPKTTPSSSPASTKKPGLRLNIGSESSQPSSASRDATASKRSSLTEEKSSSAANVDSTLRNAVEFMGLEGDKDTIQSSVDAMKPVSTPKSKSKASKIDVQAEYAQRHGDKELINLVVIGHVDAGKSTLMGHLLYQLGSVNKKTMHKYEQESKKLGKSSFAYAWVLDETDEERTRGVTMDVAQTRFETPKKVVTLLDAPGHKDFIPNMITGAAQADVAILVINAARGEFETGFDAGGQTREHALLARSLGVGQVIVVINKMDTVEFSQERYELITKKLGTFLAKQAGFREADVTFIPCSGLSGENLTKPSTEERLTSWYKATTLMEQIDNLRPLTRPIDKPLRMNVSDVFKGVGTGFNVAGRIGSGYLQAGDKVLIQPAAVAAAVKNIYIDDVPSNVAFAGDHVNITLSGVDMNNVNIGSCLCDPASPAKSATKIRAKIVIFNIDVPITKGFPVVFHYQSVNEPATIKRLLSQLNRGTGEVLKKKPRCLVKNTSAVVEVELERALCVEMYTDFKDLGRFMLRSGGRTIAAGLIEEIVQSKGAVNGATPS